MHPINQIARGFADLQDDSGHALMLLRDPASARFVIASLIEECGLSQAAAEQVVADAIAATEASADALRARWLGYAEPDHSQAPLLHAA
jgi:hypothetical protein